MKKIRKRSTYNIALWAILCLALLFPAPRGAFGLSLDDEAALGQKYLAILHQQFDFVDDEFATGYINALGQYLTKPLETKYFPFRFYIVKSSDLNAFAVPGGYVFVYSGLIEAADQVDELASVICHEMGHISARHIAYQIEQSKKLNMMALAGVLAGILVGGEAGGAIMAGTLAAGQQMQLNYSRDDERQADQLGVKYMEESGFDPSAEITIMKKLTESSWGSVSKIPNYLLTHPSGPERMADIESMISSQTRRPETSMAAQFRGQFPAFRTMVRATSMDPIQGEREFRNELERDPESILAHFGLAIVLKEKMEYGRSIEHFQDALKGNKYVLPILAHMGEAYQLEGRDDEAIEVLNRALQMDQRNRATLFLLAQSYQNMEDYSKAIGLYENLTYMKPVRNEVFYNLGVCYGRENRLARAHYNFGIYFRRLGEIEKARFHFEKANALCGNDQVLRERIQQGLKGLDRAGPGHSG